MGNKKLLLILFIAMVLAIIFLMLIQKTKIESAPKTHLSETMEEADRLFTKEAALNHIIPVNTIPSAQEIANNIKDTEKRREDFEKIQAEVENEKIKGAAMMMGPEINTSKENAALPNRKAALRPSKESKNINQSEDIIAY